MAAERPGRLFGTDGVRGKVNKKLTPSLALRLAMALGQIFPPNGHKQKVIIGKDTRRSGYMLEPALVAGLTAVGIDVLLTGPIPTPGVAKLIKMMRCDFGIMISASHNGYEDNGIKLFGPDGFKLTDDVELKIEALVASEELEDGLVVPRRTGRAQRIDDVHGRYIEFVKGTVAQDMVLDQYHGAPMRIVIDCAHGAAYKVAPTVLRELGAEVFEIGCDPDGFNINHDCGSTHPETVIQEVKRLRADIGIALDGDADRVALVDETGHLVDGDQFLAVIAKYWLDTGKLSKPGVVTTVMSNLGLERHLAALGISLEKTSVGDRHVLEHMRKYGFNVGGEQSGHVIFSDFNTTGDGLLAALQLLSVIIKSGKQVSEVCHAFTPMPQLLRNIRHNGSNPVADSKAVRETIARVTEELSDGHVLVRPSGTEPVIRIMTQHPDAARAEQAMREIAQAIETVH